MHTFLTRLGKSQPYIRRSATTGWPCSRVRIPDSVLHKATISLQHSAYALRNLPTRPACPNSLGSLLHCKQHVKGNRVLDYDGFTFEIFNCTGLQQTFVMGNSDGPELGGKVRMTKAEERQKLMKR